MNEGYLKGFEGFRERHKNQKLNLSDLVRWLQYTRTSGFPASRESEEQEIFWGDQLQELLDGLNTATIQCVKCGKKYEINFDRWKYGETFHCYECHNETFKLMVR